MLYLIAENSQGPTKIGVSRDVKSRLRQLQTGNPRKLFIVAAWEVEREREAEIELLSAEKCVAETHGFPVHQGEWIDFTPEAAIEWISGCLEGYEEQPLQFGKYRRVA